ncbi:MAG: hypothetical protein ACI8RD_003095 [Bacillariaceae sp.]|jgi:hypothetical protein
MICCTCNSDEVEDTVVTQPDQKIIQPKKTAASPSPPAAGASEPVTKKYFIPTPFKRRSGKRPTSTPDKSVIEKNKNQSSSSAPSINPAATNINPDGHGEAPPGWGNTPEVVVVVEEEEEEEEEEDFDEENSDPRGPRSVKSVPDGYIGGTRKVQKISSSVLDRIKGLEEKGLQSKLRMGRKMLTPRIITDVKETWDQEGNIKREMTHYIEEIDGTKRTEKETVLIAAGEVDPADE